MQYPEITIGSLALAKLSSGVCDAGELGVCYDLDGRPGDGFIFESGPL